MSGHNYITNPNNLFTDEEEIDDATFLKNARTKPSTNPFEEEKQLFEQKKKEIENRTLQSTERSLGLLRETEEVGIATAGELAKQREQLEKSNRQLDEISTTLRFSQKHLNGLKSVFGGLKNYLSGSKEMSPRMNSSPSGSRISDDIKSQSPAPTSPDDLYNSHPINRLRNDELPSTMQRQQQINNDSSSSQAFNQRIESNLEEMSGNLTRLKGLAIDMNSEILYQNDLIDNMNYKIEDVDLKIGKQNKEMNKLMSKK